MAKLMRSILILFISSICTVAFSWEWKLTANELPVGTVLQSGSCEINNQGVFNSTAGNTFATDENSYSGQMSAKLTIEQGSKGFGDLGGILDFESCFGPDSGKIKKGQEIWVRTRIFLPADFEFNVNGRNKFLRLRTFHMNGSDKVSEGYNDLYIDGKLYNGTYFDYIFEGEQQWYDFGSSSTKFELGRWETIEYYLKLDTKSRSEGGDPIMRVWLNGDLIGETFERPNIKTEESFISALYFFTYWDNEGAHKTQSFYVDDIFVTTNTPLAKDSQNNFMIGVESGETIAKPKSPNDAVVEYH